MTIFDFSVKLEAKIAELESEKNKCHGQTAVIQYEIAISNLYKAMAILYTTNHKN